MKTLSMKSKLTALAAVIVIAGALVVSRAKAQDQQPPPSPDRISFGMVGITRGQTARINVTNAEETHGFIVIGSLVGSDGEVIRRRDGEPVQRTMTLEPGQSAFLQINGDNLVGRDEVRLNFRPVVIALPAGPSLPPGSIVPTLEIIDNATGKTVLLYPGVIRGFNPQPDPPRE